MSDTLVTETKIAFTEFNVRQDHGKPHFIRLCDGVVQRLEKDSTIRRGEAFGVLVGTVESDRNCTITVENFEPAGVVEQHIRAWTSPPGSGQMVVGYYRSLSRGGFTLDEADRALFERCFPRDARVALLVKSLKAGAGTATFFLGEDGKLDADRVTVEFPFDLQQLAAEEPAVPASKASRGGLLSKILITGAVLTASVMGLNGLGVFDRQPTSTLIPDRTVASAAQPAAVPDSLNIAPSNTSEPKKQTAAPVAERPAAKFKAPQRHDEISEDAPAQSAPTSGPEDSSPIYTPPLAMRQFAPILPDGVRNAIRGAVVVRVRVNVGADGQVIAAEPLEASQPTAEPLATAATAAVKRWQFEPARRGAEKIPGETVLSFTFRR